jgi:hypothetical protein
MDRKKYKELKAEGDYNLVRYFVNLYESFISGLKADRLREERNWRLYSGVDFGQWDADALEQLIADGRPPTTFNFAQNYIDNVLGQIKQNPFEAEFENLEPDNGFEDVNLAQELWDRDYLIGGYEKELNKAKLGMLIFKGVVQIYPDFSKGPTPIVGIREVNPLHFLYDPNLQSDDINDSRAIFRYAWFTTDQIARENPKKEAVIRERLKDLNTASYDQPLDKICDRTSEYYNDLNGMYKVIEATWLEEVKEDKMFDKEIGKEFTVNDMKTPTMHALAKMNGNRYQMKSETKTICRLIRFCPALGLDVVLHDGNYPFQIGRQPYFQRSAKNLHGEIQGLVDVIADAQAVYNKRESLATFWQTTAANGSEFVEEDMFVDDTEFKRYVREKNIPGSTFKAASGSIAAQKQAPIRRGEYPRELLESADRAKAFMQEVTNDNAAIQGKSERSGETNQLFTSKRAATYIRLDSINEEVKTLTKEVAEAWLLCMQQLYVKFPQQFKSRNSKKFITVNYSTPEGIVNAIENMSNYNILITESSHGVLKKEEFLSRYSQLAQMTTNPIAKTVYEGMSYEYAEASEKQLEKLKEATEIQYQFQLTQMMVQTATMKMQLEQMRGQMQQAPEGGAAGAAKQSGQGNLPQGTAGGLTASKNARASNSDAVKQ